VDLLLVAAPAPPPPVVAVAGMIVPPVDRGDKGVVDVSIEVQQHAAKKDRSRLMTRTSLVFRRRCPKGYWAPSANGGSRL
jgi:hypothetical protein